METASERYFIGYRRRGPNKRPPSESPTRDEHAIRPQQGKRSEEQSVAEDKRIDASLGNAEDKDANTSLANERDQPRNSNDEWSLLAVHRNLLIEHYDFFVASQHPAASPALQRLALSYEMPSRMWHHGIQSFIELLRPRLPHSQDHLLEFIYLASNILTSLCERAPAFDEFWRPYLDNLRRYRKEIEAKDVQDSESLEESFRSSHSSEMDDFLLLDGDWEIEGIFGYGDFAQSTRILNHNVPGDEQYAEHLPEVQDGRQHYELGNFDMRECVPYESPSGVWETRLDFPQTLYETREKTDELLHHWNPLISGRGTQSYEIDITESLSEEHETALELSSRGHLELEDFAMQGVCQPYPFFGDLQYKNDNLEELAFLQETQPWGYSGGTLSDSDSFSLGLGHIDSSAFSTTGGLFRNHGGMTEAEMHPTRMQFSDAQTLQVMEVVEDHSAQRSPMRTLAGPDNYPN